MKVILAGPPQSGKSCLREGLKQAILTFRNERAGVPYPYVITACPDGEGSWFQETMVEEYPEVAKACKAVYKGKFTQDFVDLVANHVLNCDQPLTMVDIGGLIDDYNRAICEPATHIVLLSGNDPRSGENWNARMEPWREFAKDLDLTVVAEIFSDYKGVKDFIEEIGTDNILRGSVHHLERGEPIATRPMVVALARRILNIGGYSLTGKSSEATYTIIREADSILRIAFGKPSSNDQSSKTP